jgi:peptide/nickel transport system ATP-binding protein
VSDVQLSVDGLTVAYDRPSQQPNTVVWRASINLRAGQIHGLAGESGCGKSTFALAAIGYRDRGAIITEGSSRLDDLELLGMPARDLSRIWGRRVAYVGQSASTSLNPALNVGLQLGELLSLYLGLRGEKSRRRQAELLDEVGIPDPSAALHRYPHQFSGGQQQRIAIAMALCGDPGVIILDEPTTGLDVTTQARITAMLKDKLAGSSAATLYVSHDLAFLSTVTSRLAVMYAGEIVEEGPTQTVLQGPRHPYTGALLAAVPSAVDGRQVVGLPGRPPLSVVKDACSFAPRCPLSVERCRSSHPVLENANEHSQVRCFRWPEFRHRSVAATPRQEAVRTELASPVLAVRDLVCVYSQARRPAISGVSFDLAEAETIAIVGESGSGKSTLLRCIAGVLSPADGSVLFKGESMPPRAGDRPRTLLSAIQLVFQNPESSLNPRHSVADIIRRPIRLFRPDVSRSQEDLEIRELIEAVRLPAAMLHRYPNELSGGQKQRVALARAFAGKPDLLLCDEVTSALDVSVQASVLELLTELTQQTKTAVVFVSHDLAVVRTIAHRTLVMRDGSVVEEGNTDQLFAAPTAAYTRELLSAIPTVKPDAEAHATPA